MNITIISPRQKFPTIWHLNVEPLAQSVPLEVNITPVCITAVLAAGGSSEWIPRAECTLWTTARAPLPGTGRSHCLLGEFTGARILGICMCSEEVPGGNGASFTCYLRVNSQALLALYARKPARDRILHTNNQQILSLSLPPSLPPFSDGSDVAIHVVVSTT